MSPLKAPAETQLAAEALRSRGYRVTPQRLAVHEALRDLDRHATADTVLDAVSGRLANVSLPTVYSALDALEEAGLARRIAAGRGPALYDARAAEHHHLVCRRCGAVEDLDASVELDRVLGLAARTGFAPDDAEVVVRGLGARCATE
ncbi:MAG: Fur family transcriptional regulator [Solirubrobacterales bacterium]